MVSKILVVGGLSGNFQAFEKISKLHSKNDFSVAVIVGDLFADPEIASDQEQTALESLLAGNTSVPLPTYFSLGKHALPASVSERLDLRNGEVCENLFFLGKRATTKTAEGLRIVNLGGTLDAKITAGVSRDTNLPFHTEGDAKALHGANRADLLVTFAWPASIQKNSRITPQIGDEETPAEQCIADLCSALRPRYHLSQSKGFYEREPFFHLSGEGNPDTEAVTRFISVAPFGNTAGQKWLYAFTLDSSSAATATLPQGATASPLTTTSKKRSHDERNYRFSTDGDKGRHDHRSSKRSRKKGPPPGPGDCFFCLSNLNIAAHLITSIGDESYLTTAKGPLSNKDTYSLDFPAHTLLMPLAHTPQIGSISEAETRKSTYEEMTKYRHAIQTMIASRSDRKLGVVTWELARAEGIHVHWQLIPIVAETIERGLVEAGFKVEADNEKYPPFMTKTIGDGSGHGTDYFRIWIWRPHHISEGKGSTTITDSEAEGDEKELVMSLPTEARFDLQFGRRVMAKLLGLESRLQWRDCAQSEDDEKRDAEAFKTAFKDFDFSLEAE